MSQISHEQFHKISNVNSCSIENLQQISKQMSQLIAKSWLPEGEEIRKVLLSKDSSKILQMFKDHGIDIVDILGNPEVEIDWNTFIGSLEDSKDPAHVFKLVIGYPPRPSDFNLSDPELREWVNNKDSGDMVPTHPYIPVTW